MKAPEPIFPFSGPCELEPVQKLSASPERRSITASGLARRSSTPSILHSSPTHWRRASSLWRCNIVVEAGPAARRVGQLAFDAGHRVPAVHPYAQCARQTLDQADVRADRTGVRTPARLVRPANVTLLARRAVRGDCCPAMEVRCRRGSAFYTTRARRLCRRRGGFANPGRTIELHGNSPGLCSALFVGGAVYNWHPVCIDTVRP